MITAGERKSQQERHHRGDQSGWRRRSRRRRPSLFVLPRGMVITYDRQGRDARRG